MKRQRISDMFGVLAVIAVFAGCVESLDGGVTLWNFISLGAAFAFGYLSKWLDDHIEITKK